MIYDTFPLSFAQLRNAIHAVEPYLPALDNQYAGSSSSAETFASREAAHDSEYSGGMGNLCKSFGGSGDEGGGDPSAEPEQFSVGITPHSFAPAPVELRGVSITRRRNSSSDEDEVSFLKLVQ